MTGKVDYTMGPVIDDDIAARLDEALGVASRDGKVLTGQRLDLDGNWFSPIVVSDLPTGHVLTREEQFGPYLVITTVDTFGLGHWYIQGFMREQSRTVAKSGS